MNLNDIIGRPPDRNVEHIVALDFTENGLYVSELCHGLFDTTLTRAESTRLIMYLLRNRNRKINHPDDDPDWNP